MDNLKSKDESPEKVRFANSLVAMYGSGSDSSEDDDSRPDITPVIQASQQSLQDNLPNKPETQESKDGAEKLSDPTTITNPVSVTSAQEASHGETTDKSEVASVNTSLVTTQELPISEETNTDTTTLKTETDIGVVQSEVTEAAISADMPVEEINFVDCPASSATEDNRTDSTTKEASVKNIVNEEPVSIKVTQTKSDQCNTSQDDASDEPDAGKEIQADFTRKSDSKSVEDIVEEIDTILAQGTIASKIKEIQNNKSEGNVIERTVETAVAGMNLNEEMDVDPSSESEISPKEDSDNTVSSKMISAKMLVGQDMPAGECTTLGESGSTTETVDQMEITDEDLIQTTTAAEKTCNTAEEISLVAAKEEISKGAEEQNASEAKSREATITGSAEEEIPSTLSAAEEKIQKISDTENENIDKEILETIKTDIPETCYSAEEKKLKYVNPAREKVEATSSVEILEEEPSIEKTSQTNEVEEVETRSSTKIPVFEENLSSPDTAEVTDKESIDVPAHDEQAEREETKAEIVKVIEEEIVKAVDADEERSTATITTAEDKSTSVIAEVETSNVAAEAAEEISDTSFAPCEEVDNSDEIAQDEEIKFADAIRKIPSKKKAQSPEMTPVERPAAIEESMVQVEPRTDTSEVASTDEVKQSTEEMGDSVVTSEPVVSPPRDIKLEEEPKATADSVKTTLLVPAEAGDRTPSSIPAESLPEEQSKIKSEETAETGNEMEVDEVACVPPSKPLTTRLISEPAKESKEATIVSEEPVVSTQSTDKEENVPGEPQVEEPVRTSLVDVEVPTEHKDSTLSHDKRTGSPEFEDSGKDAAVSDEDIIREDDTEGAPAPGKKKEPAVRRLRQVRHPSAKAAEAAADAAFVAAVTPTRTNLKEAKIAYALANVSETSEVIPKDHVSSRQRRNRSSSAEPQRVPEPEQTSDKPVSIKLKISKDAVKIVSNETPDSTMSPAEAKRPKKDLADSPAPKAHFMKNLEVQIPQSDVSIYETTMSPGGTLRRHKRAKEGGVSPSVTLSPITLKIAKDKSNENLCCIVPEEVRTGSPVDSEGREKITLKICKDDGVVRSSVSPLVSPAERSDEARSEKAALKLAKEEAAALARNREGVPSPRSDDGENRLERITLKLAVGEKNSWSIKSADSDSALSPSSTDSGSTKVKPKISVVRMEELVEGESSKNLKRAAGNEDFVLQIAPSKRPLEEAEMVPSKALKMDEELKPTTILSDDVMILDEKSEVEEPVEKKPPIEEIILEDSSSMPADPAFVVKPPVKQPTAMDVDDDIVILSANIVKKARGRPRKVRPIGEDCAGGATAGSQQPLSTAKPQTARESQDHRPKRVCKGRERLPPKPTKPRGRYAHLLKLRQAEEAAAAAVAAAGGVLPTSTAVSVSMVPLTSRAAPIAPNAIPNPTPKPALTITKIPKQCPAKTPRGTPKPPHPKSKIIRPEAPQVFEEETRMSADISTCPTPTPSQSESSGAATSTQTTPAQQTSAQSEGRAGISFNSPMAAIDSTGILPRLVITPCTPVRSQTPALSTTGDESQSNSTTELTNKASGNKKGRMEVVDPDAKVEFTVDMIAEYMWPVDKPGVRGEVYMIQEQISQYLGVKSFKRKYPNLIRRPVEHEERQYLLDRKLVSEGLCDMGLTAVVNHEVLDVMVVDFPEKYEEYRKFSSERAQRQLTSKQKGVFSLGRIEDSTSVSQRDAASFNAMLNRERREQRMCFFDLQAFSIQYPENRRKRMVPANVPKVGHYPVALVPGQYTDYYKKYTAAELRYFPLNTVLYGPLMPGEIRNLNQNGGSEGSQSESSDSSSSDSESSNSGSSGSSDSDSSSVDSDDEMSNQIEKTESRDSVPEKDTTPCKVCSGDRQKNKLGVPEPLITCAVCSSSGHPTCLDLTVDMVPHIRKYNWQCTDCKTCAQCKDPADEDKMLFCDMCDRGYHIYCVGLRKVPEGRWHCKECAVCSSCCARDPGGVPEQQQQPALTLNNTPNKSDLPQWQHEFKKGDKGSRVYVRTLCVPCSRLWKKGRYCRLCWKCYGNKPEEEGLINCSACDRWMHSDCCRMAGSVIDEKTSNFLCELCQQKGVRSPTKNFKTPVR